MKSLITLCVASSLILAFAPAAFGGTATQTDWSGGAGFPGPVLEWQNGFTASEAIEWASAPGTLTLLTDLPYEHAITTTFGEPAGVAAGDLDGDLDLDVVSVAFQGNEVVWWENDGSGGGWAAHTIAPSFPAANSLEAHDLDDDGDIDVEACAEGAAKVSWFENDGTGMVWVEHVVDASIGSPFSVCSADFDNDGDHDLCGASFSPGSIVWWENTDGAGTSWTRHVLDSAFTNAWWAVAGDVDADLDDDIVGCSYTLGDVCWWENDSNATVWTKHVIDDAFLRVLSVRVADMDGDTDTDVLGASDRGRVVWWENDGAAGGWTKHVVAAQLVLPFSSRVADLDNDGDQDVISNERDGDRVMWYENTTGNGLVWLEHTVDVTCDGPNDVLAADLNGDLELDIIATFSWDNGIFWYEATTEYAPTGSLESPILDTGPDTTYWGKLDCTAATPAGSSIGLEVRASNDPDHMGVWVAVPSGDDLSAYIADETRYFQYRVTLATTDDLVSPSVEEIRVDWDTPSAVDEGGLFGDRFLSCAAIPNPASWDAARIHFAVARAGRVELVLYDAAGRKLGTLAEGIFRAGEHSVAATGLASGVYLYRLTAGQSLRSGKLIVP
jgi:hypothetical protein